MENVKVSLVIPVYGVEDTLERAVDSALAQTLEEVEILLVDDGSPDACPQICDDYAARHPGKVRVLHQENQGLGLARNAGAAMARGEYIAFLDSDDTIEPEMLAALYEKAREEGCDWVMCDVRVLYVDEGKETVVPCWPQPQVLLPEYVARGNNITYSVNKLFRREIWQQERYEKMLFEDIALIPSLVTRYPRMGYVPQAFYNYHRRAGTLSTTPRGDTVDLVRAFERFLSTCAPALREEAVYCVARQLRWNMTQSRTLFLPDFIAFLQRREADFRLNPYLKEDRQTAEILDFIERPVVPETFICPHCRRELPASLQQAVEERFPQSRLREPGEEWLSRPEVPENVRQAARAGRWQYVEEYLSLLCLWEEGGIVLLGAALPALPLKRLRLERCFFGFESPGALSALCFGALPRHYVIRALLDTYGEGRVHDMAFLPLAERLRDFLITRLGLAMTGRRQTLEGGVTVHLPGVLRYDFHDGENACKENLPAPPGYEVVSAQALAFCSQRVLENWSLYKRERDKKAPADQAPAPQAPASQEKALEEARRQVAALYENSASWKATRPLRALGRWLRRLRRKT